MPLAFASGMTSRGKGFGETGAGGFPDEDYLNETGYHKRHLVKEMKGALRPMSLHHTWQSSPLSLANLPVENIVYRTLSLNSTGIIPSFR